MGDQPETVTILKSEHEELLRDQQWRQALEAVGVDNWCGYDDAMDILRVMRGE